ncbi:MAG: hypothetical protein H6723_05030, partial [Sandaracinus sp.]|nr:hypothetical protein [Sandaracinus sp.]
MACPTNAELPTRIKCCPEEYGGPQLLLRRAHLDEAGVFAERRSQDRSVKRPRPDTRFATLPRSGDDLRSLPSRGATQPKPDTLCASTGTPDRNSAGGRRHRSLATEGTSPILTQLRQSAPEGSCPRNVGICWALRRSTMSPPRCTNRYEVPMRSLLVSLLSLALGCGGCHGDKGGPDAFVPNDGAFDAPTLDGAPDSGEPPPPVEICDNEIDDDGDGEVDCADLDCASAPLEPELLETADEVPFVDRVRFLWEGAACPPIQREVEPTALEDMRVSVVRGLVLNEAGEPFSGARVYAHQHEELGYTVTRADGQFDFAVNASRPVTLSIAVTGHILAQRRATPVAGTYVQVLDTVLVPVGEPTTIDLSVGGAVTLRTSDAWGARTTTVFFPPGVVAETGPADAPTPLASLTIRPQELTVGELGPLRMPGELPMASAYTYAVDLGVDGSDGHVRFSRPDVTDAAVGPVVVHVDNFLDFPVGTPVPVGTYESNEGRWVAEQNGTIVGLLAEVDGRAVLDFDGDGAPEDEALLAAWGVTPEELAFLAETKEPGSSLWRVPTRRFSSSDYNWPLAFPSDAIDAILAFLGLDAFTEDTCALGSEIRLERQVLGEEFGVVGTPFSLRYASDRQRG